MAHAGDRITDGNTIHDWIAHKLDRVAVDRSGWLALYKDRETGQHWELTYPQSEMHGGGPPFLECLGDKLPTWEPRQ